MIRYYTLIWWLILVGCCWSLNAQSSDYKPISEKDTSWYSQGFDFVIGGGIYFGNAYNAAYYNGTPSNECNLNYVFNNKYWYDEINQLIKTNYSYVGDSVFLGDLPYSMSYKPSVNISFGFKYKFNKNWGISLLYSYSQLIASDVFTLKYNAPSGNIRNDYIIEYLVGKERRSSFDLAVAYLFHPHKIVKPFVELGVQFNFVKVQEFYALIEEKEYTLLDVYNGSSYVPGAQMTTFEEQYGGPGYGFSFAAGVKLVFNKYISIDPTFYLSASSIGLTGYKNIALNYAAVIRVVMSDVVFMK